MLRAITLLMVLSFGSSLGAAPLTWKTCVERAAERNPDLLSAREALRSAEFQSRGAWSGFLPQVSASGAYSYSDSSTTSATGSHSSYSVSLAGNETLFNGFSDWAKVKQARAGRMLQDANLQAAKAKLSYDLKHAFSGVLYAQQNARLSERIVRRREDDLGAVELRFRSGRENKGSLLLSRAYLSQAKLDRLQAAQALEIPRQQLAKILRMAAAEIGEITGSLPVSAAPEGLNFQALAADTPAYRQAVAQEATAEAAVISGRAGFYPNLGLSGSIGRQGSGFWPDQDRWSVGATLSVPIFSGGRDYFAARSSAASLAAASYGRDSANREVLVSLRQAYSDYVVAVERLNVDRAFLEAARVRAEIARSKYNNGLLSFEDWDMIENDLISREKAVLQSERQRALSEAQWEQIQGKGVIP